MTSMVFYTACGVALYLLVRGLQSRRSFWVQDDLKALDKPLVGPRRGKAVICGGGIAGILAARECLIHFEEVVLVDPEFTKTLNGVWKSRIMQYDSIHAYGIPFAEGLRRLWPSFDKRADEVQQAPFDGDYNLHIDGKYLPSPIGDQPHSFSLRRSQLEPLLHRLLMQDTPEVQNRLTILDGTVRAFKSSSMGDRIASIEGELDHGEKFEIDDIDLIIDCTGRGQSGMKWLEDAGFEVPSRSTYSPHLRYSTITFTVPEELYGRLPIPEKHRGGVIAFYPDPEVSGRGVLLQNVGGEEVQLCFVSWGPSNLPKKTEDILPCLSSIGFSRPLPEWFMNTVTVLVETGSPVFATVQLASCSQINYHHLTNYAVNFIAIGDSVMVLNPIFAQGCVKVMAGILTLDTMLRAEHATYDEAPSGRLSSSFSERFFSMQATRTQPFWLSTKASDYSYATTEPMLGESLGDGSAVRWVSKMIIQANEFDAHIGHVMLVVRHMLAPESALLQPGMLMRIVRAHVQRTVKRVLGEELRSGKNLV